MVHVLASFEEDFIADGIFAECLCGWKSFRCADETEAVKAHRKHAEENRLPAPDSEALNEHRKQR
jgi:hypothetical protein